MSLKRKRFATPAPAANLQENLGNSPYLGKTGFSGTMPKPRPAGPALQMTPSSTEVFRGYIGPKYATPVINKKRSRQPNYRSHTFTSLNRKAQISNVLASQAMPPTIEKLLQPSGSGRTGLQLIAAKRQKSVLDTNETVPLVDIPTGETVDASTKTKTVRRRSEQKAPKGPAAKSTDAVESKPEKPISSGKKLRKKKSISKTQTVEAQNSQNEIAKSEISDFLGSPISKSEKHVISNLNQRQSKTNQLKNKGSSREIIPSLLIPMQATNSEIFYRNYQPVHDYPVLDEYGLPVKDSNSREAMAYVRNALTAWMNYKESLSPDLSKKMSAELKDSKGDMHSNNVVTKRSATKTEKPAKKKKQDPKPPTEGTSGRITQMNDQSSPIMFQMEPELDINGNPVAVKFPASNSLTQETHRPISKQELTAELQSVAENTRSTLKDLVHAICSRESQVPATIFACMATQVPHVGKSPVSIQVGKSLTDLDKPSIAEDECQTEPLAPPTPPPLVIIDEKELATCSTQTNPKRKRSAALSKAKSKGKKDTVPEVVRPNVLEIPALSDIPDNSDKNNNAAPIPPVMATIPLHQIASPSVATIPAGEAPSTFDYMASGGELELALASSLPETAVEAIGAPSQGHSSLVLNPGGSPDEEVLAAGNAMSPEMDFEGVPSTSGDTTEEGSNFADSRCTKGPSYPYLNGQISTVGCSARLTSSETKDRLQTHNFSGDSNLGRAKSYEQDLVPVIVVQSKSNSSNYPVGVSGIAKTWSLTSYNHPINHHNHGQQYTMSMTSIACDSPGFAASTQTVNETHAQCQVGSSYKIASLPNLVDEEQVWSDQASEADNFLDPSNLLEMSVDIQQRINDLDLGNNIEKTFNAISTTVRALSEIVTDMVNPEDELYETFSEDDSSEQEPVETCLANNIQTLMTEEPSSFQKITDGVRQCSLNPTLSETSV